MSTAITLQLPDTLYRRAKRLADSQKADIHDLLVRSIVLDEQKEDDGQILWQNLFAQSDRLNQKILARRNGKLIDVEALWEGTRADLEMRDTFDVGA